MSSDWMKALFIFLGVAVVLVIIYFWVYPGTQDSSMMKDCSSATTKVKENITEGKKSKQ